MLPEYKPILKNRIEYVLLVLRYGKRGNKKVQPALQHR